jgi:hypothetical protein
MWNWTRMGARVIITPGEIAPANFTHPLLVAQKVVPQPASSPASAFEPKADAPAVKSDKGADAGNAIKPGNSEAIELRSTVGHASPAATLSREQSRTADASSAMPSAKTAATMSDVAPSAGDMQSTSSASESAKADAKAADVKPADVRPTDVKIEAEAIKAEAPKVDTTKTIETKIIEPKAVEPKAVEKPAEPAKSVADVTPTASTDLKKDAARLPGADKAVATKPEPAKRTGQIAVFVSRKDSRLYVRQNFSPLFEAPVTIAPSDRLLGTHVFTAEADKNDPNLLHWSVVSLPVTARNAAGKADNDSSARRSKMSGGVPAEGKPLPLPDTPAEALDRITVPPDAMARIAEALTTGGSIIVSDQGINHGETGEGTDFIVPLR